VWVALTAPGSTSTPSRPATRNRPPPPRATPTAPKPAPAAEPAPIPKPALPKPPSNQVVLKGDIDWGSRVKSLKSGDCTSETRLYIIRERQGLALPAGLECDATGSGAWAGSLDPSHQALLPAGTTVNSFIIHADHSRPDVIHLSATVMFPTVILGIIASNPRLDTSDAVVGSNAVVYPTGGQWRQWFDGDSGDFITVSDDRRTLTVRSHTGRWVDQVRIITSAGP
jgi:hypothetical protein